MGEKRKVKLRLKLGEGATMPCKKRDNEFIIYSNEKVALKEKERKIIHTGLFCEFEAGLEMQIIKAHNDFCILNEPGTVDADYRGEIGVIVRGTKANFMIKKGSPVAHIVMQPHINPVNFDKKSHGSKNAAGYDIFSSGSVTIGPGMPCYINSNAKFEFDSGDYVVSLRGRSGNAIDLGLHVEEKCWNFKKDFLLTGVWARNRSDETLFLPAGSKVAQVVFSEKYPEAIEVEIEEVQSLQEFSQTERGEKGMGNHFMSPPTP